MAVTVAFMKTRGIGSIYSPGIGSVRIREDITLPGTTTATVQDGEYVVVANREATMVAVAVGTTPDAAALVSTTLTTAGYPVSAGAVSDPFIADVGSKINIKVI